LRRNPTNRWLDLKNNPPILWVHQKFTHVRPLAWGNNNTKELMCSYMIVPMPFGASEKIKKPSLFYLDFFFMNI
jgi:hypothetical protein